VGDDVLMAIWNLVVIAFDITPGGFFGDPGNQICFA
jgi:hypothetical protein